jgi:site-specific DNA-methyltransferase (adenine-specific)
MTKWRSQDGNIELRRGRWQDVLVEISQCDAVICDPPYSERTHAGALNGNGVAGVTQYSSLSVLDARALAQWCCDVCSGWIVLHTDHTLETELLDVMDRARRHTFPPVPVLQHMPRISGDGPGSHGHYLAVSRPKHEPYSTWGSLPGWYEAPREKTWLRGAKPLGLMRAIVRDYTQKGDLIVDLCAGTGTTLLAAAIEGRRAIGAERDTDTWQRAVDRLSSGYTRDMFAGEVTT